jgi:hypothetical protein
LNTGIVSISRFDIDFHLVISSSQPSLQSQGAEANSVAFNGLTNATVFGVELHSTNYSALLRRDAHNHHPLSVTVNSVVNNLAALSL